MLICALIAAVKTGEPSANPLIVIVTGPRFFATTTVNGVVASNDALLNLCITVVVPR